MAHDSNARQRRYPPELRERAVRLVAETAAERGDRHGAVTHVARQLGIGPESVRQWVRQAEIDGGQRDGLTTEERERMKQLEMSVEPFPCQHVGGPVEGWGMNIDSNELSFKVFRSRPKLQERVARREQEDSVSTGRIKEPCLWIAADRPAGQVIGNCGWSEERPSRFAAKVDKLGRPRRLIPLSAINRRDREVPASDRAHQARQSIVPTADRLGPDIPEGPRERARPSACGAEMPSRASIRRGHREIRPAYV